MVTPNLFNYATSELSQDAFILWLLDWANPQYREADEYLHAAAQTFIRALLDKQSDWTISTVECIRQKDHIDVLAIINNNIALIIEDKTNTGAHDEQLQRYSSTVREKYTRCTELHCVYYKSGNESFYTLNKLEKEYLQYIKENSSEQFKIFFKKMLRKDTLDILNLEAFSTSNAIFVDYIKNLRKIQTWSDSYKDGKVVGLWGNTAWQGFYMALEDVINANFNKDKTEDAKIFCKWDSKSKGSWENDKNKEISIWEFDMPKLSIIEDGSISIYLHLELRELSLIAHCTSNVCPKKFKNLGELNEQLKNIGLKIKKGGFRKAKNSTLASIKKLNGYNIIPRTKTVDIEYVLETLSQLQYYLPEIAKHLVIEK